jgi:hypothetical protein
MVTGVTGESVADMDELDEDEGDGEGVNVLSGEDEFKVRREGWADCSTVGRDKSSVTHSNGPKHT